MISPPKLILMVIMSDNDEVTFWVCSFFRLSSEDSEETSYYLDDSDDSGEMAKTSVTPGEMDLLGEILDTLSTHSSDQGKLSGAKSLDFFRSMDDIDYKTVVRSFQLLKRTSLLLCDNLYLVVGPTDDQHRVFYGLEYMLILQ